MPWKWISKGLTAVKVWRGRGALVSLPCLPSCVCFPMCERGVSPGCPMSAHPLGKAAVWEAAAAGWGDRACWDSPSRWVRVGDPRPLLLQRFGAEQSPWWGSHPSHRWVMQGQAHAHVQACSTHPGSAQERFYLSFWCILTPSLPPAMLGGFWGEQEI